MLIEVAPPTENRDTLDRRTLRFVAFTNEEPSAFPHGHNGQR